MKRQRGPVHRAESSDHAKIVLRDDFGEVRGVLALIDRLCRYPGEYRIIRIGDKEEADDAGVHL